VLLLRRRLASGALPHGLKDLVSGSTWLILAAGLGQGSMLLANLIVANALGVADYGRFALLQSTILILAALAQLGFGAILAQQIASLRARDPAAAGEVAAFCFLVAALLSLAFAAVLVATRGVAAEGLFRDPALAPGIAIAALALPFLAASAVQQGLFTGLERFRDLAKVALGLFPFVVLLPAVGAWQGGFEGALIGLGLAYVLRAALGQIMLIGRFRALGLAWSLGNPRAKLRLLRDFAVPGTLAGILTLVAIWGGQTLLVRSGGGADMLGLFAAAFTVKTMVMFLPSQMTGALLPILARFHADPVAGRGGLLWVNLAASLAVTALLAGGFILFAGPVMSLFGDGFAGGRPVLVILLLAAPLEAITMTLYQDIQAKGRFWRSMLCVNLPLAAIVLAGAAWLVPARQAEGLAIAWLAGWAVALTGTLFAIGFSRHRQETRT